MWRHGFSTRVGVLIGAVLVGLLVVTGVVIAGGASGSPVVGVTWQLVRFGDGAAVAAGNTITLLIDESGRLSGSTGVNRYTGTVTVDGQTLQIGTMASTRRAGSPAAMAQESAYLTALGQTTAYRLEGQQLVLIDAAGQPVLVFAPAA